MFVLLCCLFLFFFFSIEKWTHQIWIKERTSGLLHYKKEISASEKRQNFGEKEKQGVTQIQGSIIEFNEKSHSIVLKEKVKKALIKSNPFLMMMIKKISSWFKFKKNSCPDKENSKNDTPKFYFLYEK